MKLGDEFFAPDVDSLEEVIKRAAIDEGWSLRVYGCLDRKIKILDEGRKPIRIKHGFRLCCSREGEADEPDSSRIERVGFQKDAIVLLKLMWNIKPLENSIRELFRK